MPQIVKLCYKEEIKLADLNSYDSCYEALVSEAKHLFSIIPANVNFVCGK